MFYFKAITDPLTFLINPRFGITGLQLTEIICDIT